LYKKEYGKLPEGKESINSFISLADNSVSNDEDTIRQILFWRAISIIIRNYFFWRARLG
jgi:hypothetical protein